MKKLLFTTFLYLVMIPLSAEEIIGQWNGVLDVLGDQFTLVFHIETDENGYTASFDSPDQGIRGVPFSDSTLNNPELRLVAENIGAVYAGVLTNNTVVGTWSQSGQSFPLTLFREKVENVQPNRPQEPHKPYPYYEEEIRFDNIQDGITLAGTLTLPNQHGPFPAVILITGSGPQNRDEEVFGHKPFLVLADHLAKNGIAVLRFDDRGTAGSTGIYDTATSADFATDVESGVQFLLDRKEIDSSEIGLIGHSEGGLIAPIVANRTKAVSFIVLLAGPGVPGKEISLMQAMTLEDYDPAQQESYHRFFKTAIDIASSNMALSEIKSDLTEHYKTSEHLLRAMLPSGYNLDAFIDVAVETSTRPWSRFFYNHDPAKELRTITIPVLSLIGTHDVQIPAEVNNPAIQTALEQAGNPNFTIKDLENLNHMFQESETGMIKQPFFCKFL
ncbi:alpha/beta hydrolase [Spirochaeta lutea]|uniref:alpha/beta hydrolase n=1 Tax=Spirochaeta lutea TaxID=1480694 RepID=UPI0006904B15|nr:alpha/beta fold hydrolase [Spirochaeta lutea]